MRTIWLFAMAILLVAPRSEAQPEAAIIELEAYFFHGDLKYYQTIDAGGRGAAFGILMLPRSPPNRKKSRSAEEAGS